MPIFTHDCHKCIDLGPYAHNGKEYDLYACHDGKGKGPESFSVIARYGNNGDEYVSCPFPYASGKILAEAKTRLENYYANGRN